MEAAWLGLYRYILTDLWPTERKKYTEDRLVAVGVKYTTAELWPPG